MAEKNGRKQPPMRKTCDRGLEEVHLFCWSIPLVYISSQRRTFSTSYFRSPKQLAVLQVLEFDGCDHHGGEGDDRVIVPYHHEDFLVLNLQNELVQIVEQSQCFDWLRRRKRRIHDVMMLIPFRAVL